jgi:hypothetical protein
MQSIQSTTNSFHFDNIMRNLLIAGCNSAARVLAIGFLDHLAELDFFNPDEIINSESKRYKIAVYISELEPDPQVIEQLQLLSESIILIAHSDFEDDPSDLFIPIWALGSCPKALAELHKIRDFIEKIYSQTVLKLSKYHQEPLHLSISVKPDEEFQPTNELQERSQPNRPKLTNIQRKVFLQLGQGLSDENNWMSLGMCRSRYFSILEQLRSLFDVEKNWELIRLARDKTFDRVI